ncbi:MAG: hypothetical protein KBC96_10660 [Armatimonadetes bacterium]|nr:hypothetical protein [Armatimonadota bacterium]
MKHVRLCLTIAFILSFICGAGYAQYDLGQPVRLDTRPVTAGSTGWFQSNPAIASSGTIYLAVWVDMRDAGRPSDLYAARIADDGTVLDPLGIRLTTNASVAGRPDVCWNGESFFIVYAGNSGVVGTRILSLRVSPNGAVLDQQPVVVCDSGQPRNPRTAWNGTHHTVAWIGDTESPASYGGVFSRTVSLGGTVSGTVNTVCAGAVTSDLGASNVAIASAFYGPTLVVWADERNSADTSTDLYGRIVGADSDFPISTDAGAQDQPHACYTSEQFMVVWTSRQQSYSFIMARRVTTRGTLPDPFSTIISAATERQFDPQVAAEGNSQRGLVTWTRKAGLGQLDIYAGRVGFDGAALDGAGFPVCAESDRQIRPCVGSAAAGYLVCWMDSRNDAGPTVPGFGFQVRGRRVESTGTPAGSEFPLTRSAPQHKASCSAYSGREFLVCWEEWTDAGRTLYGEVLNAYAGSPVTAPTPFAIAQVAVEHPYPAAAWNGENFVVIWLDGGELSPGVVGPNKVMAARISRAGTVLDPAGIVVYDGGATSIRVRPAVASDGNRCLVAFRPGNWFYGYVGDVNGVLLSRDGALSPAVLVGTSRSRSVHEGLAACWTGQRYIVAWKRALDIRNPPPYTLGGIDYATVTADGVPSGVRSITDETCPDYFKLACSGGNVLLAAYGPEIVTRRFSLTGNLLDTTPLIIPQSAGADSVNVAWNGADYIITWLSGKENAASAQPWQDDMVAARVNYFNQLVDTVPISVTDTPLSELGGSMCAGPPGRVFLAYSNSDGPPYRSTRAKGLFLDAWLTVSSIGQIGRLYEGARVNVPGEVVTALFPMYFRDTDGHSRIYDRFYIQEGRSFGIGVKSPRSEGSPVAGNAVSFSGRLKKINGEATIESSDVNVISTSNPLPAPIGMTCRNLGGVGPTSAFTSVDGALGLYNVGLLVKTWGRVTSVEGDTFYLDDGLNVPIDQWRVGVKVYGTAPPSPYAEVTGISGSETFGDKIIRVIRATDVRGISDPPLR